MTFPSPEITDVSRPYWDRLQAGCLMYQHCDQCSHDWLPPRANCPQCLTPKPVWRQASGQGTVVSWVVFHRSYADHLVTKIPYDVSVISLKEGPRLLSNVVNSQAGKLLSSGAKVTLKIESEAGVALARFQLDETKELA